MKTIIWFCLPVLALVFLTLSGCSGGNKEPPKAEDRAADTDKRAGKQDDAASIRANLEKLRPEDRKLAEEQQFCAVHTENPLGSMGVPFKVMVKGEPVFLCCDTCETKAKAHADRTLARVQQLREKRAESPRK
jgi:hypothetical protein